MNINILLPKKAYVAIHFPVCDHDHKILQLTVKRWWHRKKNPAKGGSGSLFKSLMVSFLVHTVTFFTYIKHTPYTYLIFIYFQSVECIVR